MLRAKPMVQRNACFQEAVGSASRVAEGGTEPLYLLRFSALHFRGGWLWHPGAWCAYSIPMGSPTMAGKLMVSSARDFSSHHHERYFPC